LLISTERYVEIIKSVVVKERRLAIPFTTGILMERARGPDHLDPLFKEDKA